MKDEPETPEEIIITGEEAAALAYDPAAGELPRLVAKARGELARELIRLAVAHGVPVKYDPDLIEVLSALDVGQAIPEEIYLVVAETLAFIYWVNQEYGPGPERASSE